MKGIKNKSKAFGFIIMCIFLAIVIVLPSTAAPQSYYYIYNLKGAVGLPGTNTAYLRLDEYYENGEETGRSIYAYCADRDTLMVPGIKYRISGVASDELRAILKNTPPQITLAGVTNNVNNSWVSGIYGTIDSTLSSNRVVTGAQYAVWYHTNGFNDSIPDDDVNRLYQYLITLPGESDAQGEYEPVDITIDSSLCWFDSDGNLTIPFTYNNNFDTITLSENYEGAVINYENGEGTIFIPSSSLGNIKKGDTVSLSVTVSAERSIYDAYYLSVSEEESQDLVGLLNKNIEISASAAVSITKTYKSLSSGETAWAYGGEDAIEFFDINTGNNKWGWTNGPLSEGKYTFDLYAGAAQCDLEKGTMVGKLYVEYLDGKVSVSYKMLYGYEVKESHLFIGNDYLPKDKKGNYTNAPGQLTHEYNVEYSFDGDIYIAAHLSVKSK